MVTEYTVRMWFALHLLHLSFTINIGTFILITMATFSKLCHS